MDFLACLLIGNDSPVRMSVHNATSWGYFDEEACTWNKEVLRKEGEVKVLEPTVGSNSCGYEVFYDLGVPECFLPEVTDVGDEIGTLSSEWCNMPVGTKIHVPTGDMQVVFAEGHRIKSVTWLKCIPDLVRFPSIHWC